MNKPIKKKLKRYYMLVTDDKYELPVTGPLNIQLAAQKMGITVNAVKYRCVPSCLARKKNKYKSKTGLKIVPVLLEEE